MAGSGWRGGDLVYHSFLPSLPEHLRNVGRSADIRRMGDAIYIATPGALVRKRGNDLHLYPPTSPGGRSQLIAVGEETAELDTMLLHAADHYEQEVDGLLDGLTSIIEPVLIVVIGLILGSILVSLYLPMFELINTVG